MAGALTFRDEAAAEYDRAFAHVTAYFMPFLLRAAHLAPGMRVLDIATGTGLSAEAALAAVGPTGHVTAADVSPDMAVQNMLLAARALGLGATLTTLYLSFEKEAEAAFGLPADWHSYAILPVGYPVGRFGPARRVAWPMSSLDRWGQAYQDL
jgi:nitroreductase